MTQADQFRGIDWKMRVNSPLGAHTVTAAEATANEAVIVAGDTDATCFLVQVFRAGVNVTSDAVVTLASGELTVADGAATYNLTAGDVIMWMVW